MTEENSLLDRTVTARDYLAISPTFAMSLGAKELFHTNFLAFLLESRDKRLSDLQTELRRVLGFPVNKDEHEFCAAWREPQDLDLVLVPLRKNEADPKVLLPTSDRCLVVEAKLKSLPTHGQLDDYLRKSLSLTYSKLGSKSKLNFHVNADLVHRVLLTPAGTKIHDDWESARWEDVSKAIARCLPTASDDTGLRGILADYSESLKQILCIVTNTRERLTELLLGGLYTSLRDEITHHELRRLRLHDLVGKVAFDEWLGKLHDELLARMRSNLSADCPAKTVTRLVHFSNGQAGLDLEVARNGLTLGVQVQGTQLRRFVCSKTVRSTLEEDVLNEPLLRGWLQGHACDRPLTGVDGKPFEQTSRQRRSGRNGLTPACSNLRAFDPNRFLYTAVDLKGLPLAKVHEEVLYSMLEAVNLSVT